MAFAGLKKQINKANQYVTEKMGGAEGTKLDLDFVEMERKTDVTVELVEEVQVKTKEYLQPNPTARAKMAAVKGISKLSGQAKSNTYPQPEGILADCMLLYGRKLGEDSIFAQAMIEMGESLKQMADVKYSLDDNIKQNFLEPMHHLQTKDLKEVMHHRKKLQGRRLDFDCKRRRQAKGSHITDDEIRSAEDKFAESLHLAQVGMYHLLENDVEQVSQLVTMAEAMLDFHQQSTEILKILVETLQQKKEDAINRPKPEFVPKTLNDLHIEGLSSTENGGRCLNQYTNDNNISRIKNSHHQHFSSQQNLSNNNNYNHNNNSNSSNFQRNKIYGSQQSLSTISNRSSNNSISYNNNNKNNSKKLSTNTTTTTTTISSSSSNNRNSIDWLNAWNNPPPQIQQQPPPSQFKKPQQQQQHHQTQYKMMTGTTTIISPPPQTNNNNNNHNNYTRTMSSSSSSGFNDPWSVNKPTHLELTDNGHGQARSTNASPLPSPMRSPARTPMPKASGPCCSALYDFEPENPGELGFKENDVIQLINRVDENWYEGSVNGRTGYFPQSYVQIVVPLPN